MAVKFLSGVNLEGNDLSNVGSIKVASIDLTNLAGDEVYYSITADSSGAILFGGGTFDRFVTFNDTIQSGEGSAWSIESGGFAEFKDSVRTPKGEIGILDMQSQDPDAPNGIIVFDMIGSTYAEDNLVSGISHDGNDLAIKNGRDIYFYTHGNGNPGLVISDLNSRFAGMISCGEGEGVAGGISILDSEGKEATCINARSESWIGGNLTIHGTILDINGMTLSVGSDGLTINTGASDVNISALSVTGLIGCNRLNVGVDGNGVVEFYRNTYIKRPTKGGLEINTDGVGLTVIGSIGANSMILKNETTGESDTIAIDTNGNVSCLNFAADNITADALTVGGSAVATKTYVDEMFNKLMTNPDETVNSITELLALIESNKENLGNRYNDTFEGDGTTKTFTVTHDFNTWNVVVAVYDNTTRKQVFTDVTLASTDAVTIGFDTAPAEGSSYEVIVLS